MTSSDDMLYCYLLDIVSHLQPLSHRCQLSFNHWAMHAPLVVQHSIRIYNSSVCWAPTRLRQTDPWPEQMKSLSLWSLLQRSGSNAVLPLSHFALLHVFLCSFLLVIVLYYLHEGDLFFTLFVCLFFSRITRKLFNRFHKIRWKGGTWTTEETIRFWR